jgi:hypothetical protein
MLGVESENVRVHVAAAVKILSYLNYSVNHSAGKEHLHEEQVGKFKLFGDIIRRVE